MARGGKTTLFASRTDIPNVQSRYAAGRWDAIEYILIIDGIKPPESDRVLFTCAVPTIFDEMTHDRQTVKMRLA